RVVALGAAALLCECRPEAELVPQLRRVAAIEQALEEDRGLGVLRSLGVREAEMHGVPLGLACHGLEEVGVDLRQRVVARDVAKGVGKAWNDACVMQRMTRLVQR